MQSGVWTRRQSQTRTEEVALWLSKDVTGAPGSDDNPLSRGDFGERLERLLKMAELSPQDLAELFGVTEPTERRWLK